MRWQAAQKGRQQGQQRTITSRGQLGWSQLRRLSNPLFYFQG